jgi:hypothetical protein
MLGCLIVVTWYKSSTRAFVQRFGKGAALVGCLAGSFAFMTVRLPEHRVEWYTPVAQTSGIIAP